MATITLTTKDEARERMKEAQVEAQTFAASSAAFPIPAASPSSAMLGATETGPTPAHPVGELRLFASLQIPMVEVLQSREAVSDTDLLTKYAPRILEQVLDQIERFRTSNELDPVTTQEQATAPAPPTDEQVSHARQG